MASTVIKSVRAKTLPEICRKSEFLVRIKGCWLSNLVALLRHANDLDHVSAGLMIFYKFYEVAGKFSHDCRAEFNGLASMLVELPTRKEFKVYKNLLSNFIDMKYEKLLRVINCIDKV